MIPASYMYKDVFVRTWGDPKDNRAQPVAAEPPRPGNGHFAGLAGLLAAVMPLQLERTHRAVRGHA